MNVYLYLHSASPSDEVQPVMEVSADDDGDTYLRFSDHTRSTMTVCLNETQFQELLDKMHRPRGLAAAAARKRDR